MAGDVNTGEYRARTSQRGRHMTSSSARPARGRRTQAQADAPDHCGLAIAATLCLAFAFHGSASARVLFVGPDEPIKTPAEAAAQARDGDTVAIEPNAGGYYSCAIWRQNDLTLEGEGGGATITDATCAGKALFVIDGRNVIVRNLTFARARVRDGNGAGIRAEGTDLRIEHCRFVDNEVGVLAGDAPASTIVIANSVFTGNGRCDGNCTDGLEAGHVAILSIEHSEFHGGDGRDEIRSLAAQTQIAGSTIADGASGPRNYLVELPDGGSLTMQQNLVERRAARQTNAAIAIVAAGIGAQPVRALVFRDNLIKNDTGAPLIFFLNWTGQTPQMGGNTLDKQTHLLSASGHYFFLLKSLIHTSLQKASDYAHRLLATAYGAQVKSFIRDVLSGARNIAHRLL